MSNEIPIPIAYELDVIPKQIDMNIALVEGQVYEDAVIISFRSRIDKLRESLFNYIILLSLFGLCIFAYVIIILTIQ